MDESHEGGDRLLAAQGNAAEAFEFVEEVLDLVVLFVELPVDCRLSGPAGIGLDLRRCAEIIGNEDAQRIVVVGASIEATLALWASSLREVKERMRPLFGQARVAASANSFLDGLLGDERRKTGWMRAEAAGDAGPWRQQAILGRGRWDADALRDVVRDYALEHLGADDAVLVIDETGFLKQGKA